MERRRRERPYFCGREEDLGTRLQIPIQDKPHGCRCQCRLVLGCGRLMVASCPSNAGGIGGRWRSATEEDELGINEIARNYYTGGTNVLAANFHSNNHGNSGERYSASAATRTRNRCRVHYHPFLHEPQVGPFVHGSPFDEDQALRSFQTQFHQFDRGSSDCPSTQCLP